MSDEEGLEEVPPLVNVAALAVAMPHVLRPSRDDAAADGTTPPSASRRRVERPDPPTDLLADVNRVVSFNVGGEPFDVLLTSLAVANLGPTDRADCTRGEVSLRACAAVGSNALYRLALTPAEEARSLTAYRALGTVVPPVAAYPRVLDDKGRIFIDRSPVVFRAIVSLIRGYSAAAAVPPALLPAVRADCQAFGLAPMLRNAFPLPVPARFTGGGSAGHGRVLSSGTIVSLATGYLTSGVCTVAFQIKDVGNSGSGDGTRNSGTVGVGVVSRATVNFDREFHGDAGSACYYSNGELHSNLSGVRRKEDTNAPFNAKDAVVAVTIDFDTMKVAFKRVHGTERDQQRLVGDDPTAMTPAELVRLSPNHRYLAIGNDGNFMPLPNTGAGDDDGALAVALFLKDGARAMIYVPAPGDGEAM